MIYIAGAGATAHAAKAMRRVQRSLDRRVALTKQRRAARRRARYRHVLSTAPVRVDFPCAFLCGACGYFLDEGAAEDDAPVGPCPACNEVEWLDLSLEPIADGIRDMEADARIRPPALIRRLVLGASLGIVGIVLVGLAVASLSATGALFVGIYAEAALWTVLAAMFGVPTAYFALPRPLSVLALRLGDRTPHRWHVPMRLPAPDVQATRTLQGVEARPVDDTIEAPISGRECLAYQVSVLFDVAGDARPPEWVLQEQRSVAVDFGEVVVDASALYLESDAAPVETVAGDDPPRPGSGDEAHRKRYAEVKRYLRQRGLFLADGEFRFFEARLEPGDVVDVSDYDGRTFVARHR